MTNRFIINIFIFTIIFCSFGFGIFEKFISPGFNESAYKSHMLFKDDTRRVRDQDFWPFSSYPMFSDGYHTPTVSRIEARGIRSDGSEIILQISDAFPPLWENGLHRMLKKAIVHKKDIADILNSLANNFQQRFNNPKAKDPLILNYSQVVRIDWFIQSWPWEQWLSFRIEQQDLSKWTDFKKSNFVPSYHKKFFSSEVAR